MSDAAAIYIIIVSGNNGKSNGSASHERITIKHPTRRRGMSYLKRSAFVMICGSVGYGKLTGMSGVKHNHVMSESGGV